MRAVGLPEPARELKFCPGRRFRFDFAYPEKMLAIEVQGQTWHKGAHSSGTGLERDYEKMNLAQSLGWRVYQFSSNMVESGEAVRMIERDYSLQEAMQ